MTQLRRAFVTALASAACSAAAAAQLPTPVAIPGDVVPEQRDDLSRRRRALLAESSLLRDEVRRHNAECSAVTEGTPEDQRCIAAQRDLNSRLQRHRGEVDGFAAAVGSASRARRSDAGPATAAVSLQRTDREIPVVQSENAIASIRARGRYSVTALDGSALNPEQLRAALLQGNVRIRTERNSEVVVTRQDGYMVAIRPNTDFTFASGGDPVVTLFELSVGNFRATRRAASDMARELMRPPVKVRATNGASFCCSVRGTDFDMTAALTGSGALSVYEGLVSVDDSATGAPIALVRAGHVVAWNDSGHVISLGSMGRAQPANEQIAGLGKRATVLARAKEHGLVAAVLLLLGLVTAQLVMNRRKSAANRAAAP